MKYDLEIIKRELSTLPEYDNQIYLQGDAKDMDPIKPTIGQNYLIVDETEKNFNIPLFNIIFTVTSNSIPFTGNICSIKQVFEIVKYIILNFIEYILNNSESKLL